MNRASIKNTSLTARLVRSAGVWCLFSLGAGGVALSSLFANAMRGNFDAALQGELVNLAAAVEVSPAGALEPVRRLADPRYERAYSGWYWQVSTPQHTVLRSRSLWDEELPLSRTDSPALSEATSVDFAQAIPGVGPNAEAVRILTRRVQLPGALAAYRFTVARTTETLDANITAFNRTLWASLLVLGAGLLTALIIQVRYGLGPLRVVHSALAAIRAGAHERLEGEFPKEIAPLVTELNALLDQNTRVVERARTQVGNLAHGLKTPLSVLWNNAADLPALDRAALEHQLRTMQEHIDRYLARARTAGPVGLRRGHTPVLDVVNELARTLAKIYREREFQVTVTDESSIAFAGDSQDLQEILGNLLDNAYKWGESTIRVAISGAPEGWFEVEVADDGPGLGADRRENVLLRGKRLDEATPGSGLGLDIARDVVELYGGNIELGDAPEGGLLVRVRLPANTANGPVA
ncbi:MAG: signal transduction histidine kinase [Gammaproteobacteria bacterium]|jgi:signal transduction histidine kinase